MMCTPPKQPRAARRSIHAAPDWLWTKPADSAVNGRPVRLEDLTPPHAESLRDLSDRLSEVKNLRLRAAIVVATCPDRYGLPCFRPAAGKDWKGELDRLITAVQEELANRKDSDGQGASHLVPVYSSVATKPELLRADPGILRHLMQLATQVAAKSLPSSEKEDVDPAGYLAALKKHPATAAVLALSNADPIVEISSMKGRIIRGESTQVGSLTWPGLVRVKPTDDAEPLRAEKVVVELVDYRPVGEGKPIRGVGGDMSVRVQVPTESGWKETLLPAREVTPGMRVRGYAHLGDPRSTSPIPLTEKHKPEWFTVVANERHEVPISLAIGMAEPDAAANAEACVEAILCLDHAVLLPFGEQQVRWSPGWHVDPGAQAWVGLPTGRVQYIKQLHTPREFVEFSLTADQRSQNPNSIEIVPAESAPRIRLLAEARPSNAGPIDPNEMVKTADGRQIPLREIRVNPDVMHPRKDTTVILGVHRKPQDDPWPLNPEVSEHPTTALKMTAERVAVSYVLEFEDGRTLRLGPGNWLLQRTQGGIREIPVDLDHVKKGMEIVNGADAAGAPTAIKLARIRAVPKPGYDYTLIELVNTSWCSVNGVVVSIDYRPWHESEVGLQGRTLVAKIESGRDAVLAVSRTAIELPVEGGGQQFAQAGLRGASLALFDPALGRLAEGVIDSVQATISTRMVRVRAERDGQKCELHCGPKQPLLAQCVRFGRTEIRAFGAEYLTPQDRVFVARAGDTKADLWRVTQVTPLFYPYVPIHDLFSGERQFLDKASACNSDVGLANGIAFLLSVPASRPHHGRLADIPSQDGRGPGTGRNVGEQSGGGPSAQETKSARFCKPPEILVSDEIELPDIARQVLETRGDELVALFNSERNRLPKSAKEIPNTEVTRFWNNILSEPKKGQAAKGVPLSGESRPDIAMDRWFREVMARRQHFLRDGRNGAYLSCLMFLETVTASWFYELVCARLPRSFSWT